MKQSCLSVSAWSHRLALALTLLLTMVVLLPAAPTAAATGGVLAWGLNSDGQTNVPAGLTDVTAVAAGNYHSLALKNDGTVVGWGANDFGQSAPPVGLTGVRAIAAGNHHSLALKNDGTVVGWGANYSGQVDVPAGLSDVVAVAAGLSHSVALRGDGSVISWGNDSGGQTVVPDGLDNVTAIAAGAYHTAALKSDGTVVSWGENSFGVVDTPDGLRDVIAIAAGGYNTMALKGDGTLVVWGWNADGQLDVPNGLNDVVAIAVGFGHLLVLQRDGTVVAWGRNDVGQTNVPTGLRHVSAISGAYHTLVAQQSGSTPADVAPPVAAPVALPAANAAGWNNGDVTVTWNWSDSGSGLNASTCPTNSTSDGEGTILLTANCMDLAGNKGDAAYTVKVDKTKPTISAAATSNPNAAGWYNGPVTVHFTCADALSAVAICPPDQTLSGEGASISSTAQTVSDAAGNTSAPSNIVMAKIDRTPPAVSVTGVTNGATYLMGAVPAAACSTTDALSGVTTSASLTITGGTLAGTGNFTATCAGATDKASNAAPTVSVNYRVASAVLVRHAPVLNSNARVEGSLWLLSGEDTTLNSNATIAGDLLVPGSPTVVRNSGTLGSTVSGSGSAQPEGYRITLNSGANVSRLVTRTDPIALPAVATPPTPSGTRDVVVNQSGQSLGNPATIRNLTLNSGAGTVAVPPGTYGQWTANSNTSFVLGVAGASTPSVYNLQSLTLNSGSGLEVVGPVVLNLANGMSLNSIAGTSARPDWLVVNVAAGAVTLNSGSTLYGALRAPSSVVTLNSGSRLEGMLLVDRLVLNGGTVRATP